MQLFAQLNKTLVTFDACRARSEFAEVSLHLLRVGDQVEHGVCHRASVAIAFEEATPLWIERKDFEVVLHLAVGFFEHPLENTRKRQDGRPHVKAKTLRVMDRGFPTQPIVLVEQGHVVPARSQHARAGQASESPPTTTTLRLFESAAIINPSIRARGYLSAVCIVSEGKSHRQVEVKSPAKSRLAVVSPFRTVQSAST